MTFAGGQPHSDITGRMALFGRLFGEQVGIPTPRSVPSAEDLVRLVMTRVPRAGGTPVDSPVFEAAAFVGEWFRERSGAVWVAEGPFEPHLQVTDPSHAIVYVIPLVQVMRTAATAGYDGLPSLLEDILADVGEPATAAKIEGIRVTPASDRGRVSAWVLWNRHLRNASRAALWRRCAVCSRNLEEGLLLPNGADWESEAASAASVLASRPSACPCGGAPGESSRFLMLRADKEGTRVADIHITPGRTRLACWRVEGDRVAPLDARLLTPT